MVKNGNVQKAVKDMLHEFQIVRKNAKQALLDRNADDFRMYSAQMKSFLQMEIHDPSGNVGRIVAHLSHDDIVNPYNLRPIEDMEVTAWMAQILQQLKELH